MVLEFIGQLLVSTGLSAALVGLLIYLSRNLILERLKRALKYEYDAKLEDLRKDIRLLSFGKETRFAQYHNRQFEVVEELYA